MTRKIKLDWGRESPPLEDCLPYFIFHDGRVRKYIGELYHGEKVHTYECGSITIKFVGKKPPFQVARMMIDSLRFEGRISSYIFKKKFDKPKKPKTFWNKVCKVLNTKIF